MTEAQRRRVEQVRPRSLWAIPDGSWLAVRTDERGTWVEVVDPEATVLLAFDFATNEPLRSVFPEGGEAP